MDAQVSNIGVDITKLLGSFSGTLISLFPYHLFPQYL